MTESSYPATIAAPVDHELVIKKSRFLAHIEPIVSTEEADEVIARVRRASWDARHHCAAQVTGLLGDRARSTDDGEPSGTAGVPMLEVLRRRELTDVVAVVTRYFGGVKLGAGGLVRAYSSVVAEALDLARLVDRRELIEATLRAPHSEAGRFENMLREWSGTVGAVLGETEYATDARFVLWLPAGATESLIADVASLSGGEIEPVFTGEKRVIGIAR